MVVVATVRALKNHGGVAKADLGKENLEALEAGLPNLLQHVETVTQVYQLPCETVDFAAAGSLLMHAGLRLPQRFCGTGYTEGVRPMPDFSARIWMLEAREVAASAPDMI